MRHVSAIVAIALLGLVLAHQGWRARWLTFDLVPYADEAAALLAGERLPEKGSLTSLGSYSPPGTAWLLAPGMAVMRDVRLYETLGSVFLYVGTVAGVFALAALCVPSRFALLAATVWGLSEQGLFFAHSLWPPGHPFFFVWMIYFTLQWIRQRRDYYLAAAVIAWSAGMFVFMPIAPALVVLPVAWWFYRPSWRWRTLGWAGLITIAFWYPYLRFDSHRNFVNIRSQLLRQVVYPPPNAGWCDASLLPADWISTENQDDGALRQAVQTIARRVELGPSLAIANFQSAVPGGSIVLTVGVVGGLLAAALVAAPTIPLRTLQICGALLLAAPFAVNEWTVARFLSADGTLDEHTVLTLRSYGLVVLLTGAVLVFAVKRWHGWVEWVRAHLAGFAHLENLKIVALCLAAAWLALLSVIDGPRPERFWWLWSVQVVVLTASLSLLRPPLLRIVLSAAVLVAVAANSTGVGRLKSWAADGWSGKDAPVLNALDSVAQSMQARHVRSAAIGYEIGFERFMATLHASDPRYKVGNDLDFILRRRHGLTNSNQCAEGLSSGDAYRVVAHPAAGEPPARFNVARDPAMRAIHASPYFTVLAR